MHVYLIHATETNRYKIGITSRTVESRLSELNGSQSAYPLALITSIKNTNYKGVEQHLHEKYNPCRVHGEWFEFDSLQLVEVTSYFRTLDMSVSQIKPILKPRPKSRSINSRIPFKEWLLPLLLGIGIVSACHSLEFFESPAKQQPVYQKVVPLSKIRKHPSSRVGG